MPTDIPAQSIIAIATLVAALITGAMSFVNLTMTKELKTSEFRQSWIDSLRDDLAAYFSAIRTVARAHQALYRSGDKYKDQNFPWSDAQVAEQRQIALEVLYRIKLRLNPDEKEHEELLRLLNVALEEQRKMTKSEYSSDETVTAIDLASNYARPVLKTEWKRVKDGERAFRVARNWVTPIIISVCLVFIGVLVFAQFK